jgi:chromosome partitioning protein
MPLHHRIEPSKAPFQAGAESEDQTRFGNAMAAMSGSQFVVIDTPGSDSFLSRLGHAHADTLITPLNDSFLDLEILADLDVQRRVVLAPSIYSKMVWEQSNKRAAMGRAPVDWVVVRNRLLHVTTRNKCQIAGLLEQLATRIGFRLSLGFGERVVFRELFHKGLTVLDLADAGNGLALTSSQTAACREIDGLLSEIGALREAAA